ncbi:unnamed protein product [Taenia asiatica]|uniref:Aa_trans domain-containing protein n=1 Tax=Taenia asiatica TaxID=60517 RepID=A0A0R3WDH0_TAEAS|nr:unnamed protein product [Taenia asiatica]
MLLLDNVWYHVLLGLCIAGTMILLSVDRLEKGGLFGSKFDVVDEASNGGRRWITHNIVTVALATSCAFSPSIISESIYLCSINSLCLFAARSVSLLLCVWVWRKIAQLGLSSMTAFMAFRFNNRLPLFLYYTNSISSFIYILFVYNGPLLYSQLEYFKLNANGFLLFIGFMLLCSFGGMRIALPLCSVLSVMEICGDITLLTRTEKFNETTKETDRNYCNGYNPLHLFGTVFPLLLTAQPLYQLYYHIGSQRKATIGIIIGYCIFFLKFILAFFASQSIKLRRRRLGIPVGQEFDATFPGTTERYNQNLQREVIFHSELPDDHVNRASVLGELSGFTLNCIVYGSMATFYSLRLCQLVGELSEKLTSYLPTTSIKLSGGEMQRTYCSLYSLMACLVFVSLLSADRNIVMPGYRHVSLYVPHITNFFMLGVTTTVVIGAMAPHVRFVHILSAWVLTTFLTAVPMCTILWSGYRATISEAVVDWETPIDGIWLCLGVWTNLGCLLINTFIAVLLGCLPKGRGASISEKSIHQPQRTNQFPPSHSQTNHPYKETRS